MALVTIRNIKLLYSHIKSKKQEDKISNTMKATHFSIGLGFILLLASCMQDKVKNSDVKTILFEDKYTDLTEKIDCQFIPLETNDSCQVSTVSDMVFDSSRLYLIDGKSNLVFRKSAMLVQVLPNINIRLICISTRLSRN